MAQIHCRAQPLPIYEPLRSTAETAIDLQEKFQCPRLLESRLRSTSAQLVNPLHQEFTSTSPSVHFLILASFLECQMSAGRLVADPLEPLGRPTRQRDLESPAFRSQHGGDDAFFPSRQG